MTSELRCGRFGRLDFSSLREGLITVDHPWYERSFHFLARKSSIIVVRTYRETKNREKRLTVRVFCPVTMTRKVMTISVASTMYWPSIVKRTQCYFAGLSAFFFTSSLNAMNPFILFAPDFFSGFMVKDSNPEKSSYCTKVVDPGCSFEGRNSNTWSPVNIPGKLPRHFNRSSLFSWSIVSVAFGKL